MLHAHAGWTDWLPQQPCSIEVLSMILPNLPLYRRLFHESD